MSYDSRLDALEAARDAAPYRDEDRLGKRRDPDAVLVGVVGSICIALDWLEGDESDRANAAELLHYVCDDIEDLIPNEHRTQRGRVPSDTASEIEPLPRSTTDGKSTDPSG